MKLDIKSVHFDAGEATKELVEKKVEKLQFADTMITDLRVTMTKGTHNDWTAETNFHLKWGVDGHISETAFNLHEAIEKLFDRVEVKVKKEKDKVQDHSKG